MDPFEQKIHNLKKFISDSIEYSYLSSLRKTTILLLFESIAKITKEKISIKEKTEENPEQNIIINIDVLDKINFIKIISEKIEENLNEYYKDAKEKYIRRAKSIITNLRLNNELYNGLFKETISPEEIARMDEKEMASTEIKEKRIKKEEESFNSRRSDWDRLHNTFVSGMYKCGKCKHTKTTYHQVQIRRADEPMTTFVTCLNCNNNWKC